MKKIFAAIFIFVIFLSFNNGFNSIRTVRANTITVPDDYPTIQVAIARATDGDTVFVKNGVYYTSDNNLIIIDKTISLIGEDPEKTIITGLFTPYIASTPAIRVAAPNVTISGFTITNCRIAIAIANYYEESFPSGCKIIYNNIVNNSEGIRPLRSDLLIYGNNITNNQQGITGWNTENIIISGNNIAHNGKGVNIGICRNITVSENCIFNNTGGLDLVYYGPHFVYGNNITNNDWGIRFAEGCANAEVYGNIINQNNAGIVLLIFPNEGDIVVSGVGNKVFGNFFIDNSEQVIQNEREFVNIDMSWSKGTDFVLWDNGTVGNYWNNYNGTDLDHNQVGDSPYIIDENNQDNYPLMSFISISQWNIEYRGFYIQKVDNSYIVSENLLETYISPLFSTIEEAKEWIATGPTTTPNPATEFPTLIIIISVAILTIIGFGIFAYFKKYRRKN